MNCRGEKKRREIIEAYNVVPIFRGIVLKGVDHKRSDAAGSDELTGEYFMFLATPKTGKGASETITCGAPTGRNFIELLNLPMPELFNPLVSVSTGGGSHTSSDNDSSPNIKKDPDAATLLYAINLALNFWGNQDKPGPMWDIKKQVMAYCRFSPYPSQVKGVNTILRNRGGQTLSQIIEKLHGLGNPMKPYDFSRLAEILREKYPDEAVYVI